MGRVATYRLLRRLQANTELQRLLAEVLGPKGLSLEDQARLEFHLHALFRLYQELFSQRDELDSTVWAQITRVVAWLILSPGVMPWWHANTDSFDADFVDSVDAITAGSGVFLGAAAAR